MRADRIRRLPRWAKITVGILLVVTVCMLVRTGFDIWGQGQVETVIADAVLAVILLAVAGTVIARQKPPVGPLAYNVLDPHGSEEQENENVYRNPLGR